MRFSKAIVRIFDPQPLVRASRIRLGPLRVSGVPAILAGITGLVAVAGVLRVLEKASVALPETFREARLLEASRRGHPQLRP